MTAFPDALDEFLPLPNGPAGARVEQPWPEELGEYFSYSRVTTFDRCPELYRRRYLLGEKERPASPRMWGTADHRAHEHNFAQKVWSHEDVPVGEVEEAFVQAFDVELDQAGGEDSVEWDKNDEGRGGAAKANSVRNRGRSLVRAYHEQVSPHVQPVAVEQKFELQVPLLPVYIMGYVDLETEDRVIDRKVTATKATRSEWFAQAILYQSAVRKPFEFHLSTRTKTPAVWTPAEWPQLYVPRNESEIPIIMRLLQVTLDTLRFFFERYGPNEPWPGVRGRPLSPCSYCGFGPNRARTCPWWTV